MSIHSSLRGIDTLKGERSVLSRVERIAKLRKDGKFDAENQSVHGLPKVRTKFKVVGPKKVKAEESEASAAGTVAAAAPAAKGAPAKGAPAAKAAPAKGAPAAKAEPAKKADAKKK